MNNDTIEQLREELRVAKKEITRLNREIDRKGDQLLNELSKNRVAMDRMKSKVKEAEGDARYEKKLRRRAEAELERLKSAPPKRIDESATRRQGYTLPELCDMLEDNYELRFTADELHDVLREWGYAGENMEEFKTLYHYSVYRRLVDEFAADLGGRIEFAV